MLEICDGKAELRENSAKRNNLVDDYLMSIGLQVVIYNRAYGVAHALNFNWFIACLPLPFCNSNKILYFFF